eukprot:sb/3461341/
MADEQRRQIKRAILSELNKEISRKTGKELTTGPAKLYRTPASRARYDAQSFVDKKSCARPVKKAVNIPTPTPRTVHPPSPYEKVRSFADHWMNQVFGDHRSQFRKAVKFHKERELHKALSQWKVEMKFKQTEWKLVVRADCHYRFFLRERYFDTWRRFLITHRSAAENKLKAELHCKIYLEKRYFAVLRKAVVIRKERDANTRLAMSVYERGVYKRAFSGWHRAMAGQLIYHEQEFIALHFWSLSLQRHCLAGWVRYSRERKVKKQIVDVVGNLYRGKVLHRALNCWLQYHRYRKNKAVDERKANMLLQTKLQHRYFYLLQEYAVISARSKAMEVDIRRVSEKARIRRALVGWKKFCEQRTLQKEHEIVAVIHYNKRILEKCLTALRSYKDHQKETEIRKESSERFRRHNILQQAFRSLIIKLDQTEEDKLKYRTLMARKHYSNKLLTQCFTQLIVYRDYRVDRKECYSLASEHYQTKITATLFTNWHLFVAYRKTIKLRTTTAMEYRDDLIYHKYFYTWVKEFHMSKNRRQDERMAMLHLEKRQLASLFSIWKSVALEKLEGKEKWMVAQRHHREKLLRRTIGRFSLYQREKENQRIKTDKARQHYHMRVMGKVYSSWKDYKRREKEKKDKITLATLHHERRTVKYALSAWLTNHRCLVRAKAVVSSIQEGHSKLILREHFQRWRVWVREERKSFDLNTRALEHYRESMCGKVLTAWFGYVDQRARDHLTKLDQIEEGRKAVATVVQQAVLRKWSAVASQRMKEREGMELAEAHCRKKVLGNVMDCLKTNAAINSKKRHLNDKKYQFLVGTLVKRTLARWRHVREEQIKEQQQSETALWYCMDLIGSYGDVSDDEMEFVPGKTEEESTENREEPNETEDHVQKDTDMEDTSSRENSLSMPGLVSYTSHSPGRTTEQNALNSLLSTYDDNEKSMMEERDEQGDIEKQYDVTVANSDEESDSESWLGRIDEEGNVKLPPEPKGKCSSALQRKIENEINKRKRYGVDICSKMRGNKEFRNPSIYDKLIDMFGVNEAGTNFSDPMLQKRYWKTDSFYKQLAEKQQKDYDKREADRRADPNSKIKQQVMAEQKKSKWDEGQDKMDKKLKAQLTLEKLNKQLKAVKNS